MPVPFFADSLEDKPVLLAQQSLRDVMELARGPSSPRRHRRGRGPRRTC